MRDSMTVAEMDARAADIARAMGAGWSAERCRHDEEGTYPTRIIRAPDRLALALHFAAYRQAGRISISGDYPKARNGQTPDVRRYSSELHGHDSAPSMTVADTKTPAQIAADIRRRILPDVAAWTERVLELLKHRDTYADTCKSNAERFAAAAGCTVPGRRDHDDTPDVQFYRPIYATVQGDSVRFGAASYPLELACTIVQAIVAYQDAHKEAEEPA